MDELTIFHSLLVLGAIASTVFGFLFLFSPDSVHRLSEWVNRSILAPDAAVGRKPRLSGTLLLLVGATLCLLLFL